MRIISQNRKISVNFDNIALTIENCNAIVGLVGKEYGLVLGRYGDEKRAKEVFEDIHNAYAPVYSVSSNMEPEEIMEFVGSMNVKSNNIAYFDDNSSITTYGEYVYYMPDE